MNSSLLQNITTGRMNRRGAMLLVTIIAMFVTTSLVLGALTITANSLYQNHRQQLTSLAFNVAESGAEMAALWIRDQAYPPAYTSPFDPFGGAQAIDGGSYQVTIYPGSSNPTSYLKTYRIVSEGTSSGVSKSVEIVVRQSSFGKYAYFTDRETSSISGGAIWWKAGEIVDGPVHSNNSGGSNFNINYNGSTAPIFLDMVTGSGSTISYSPSRPRNETTFRRIFADGSKGYKLRVPRIELPPSSDTQRDAAWGSSSGLPSTTGVYLRSDFTGGIYIVGDAQVQLALDVSGNQQFIITQGTDVTTVTLNKTTGTTSVTGPVGTGSPTSSSSLPNGVVYCTGNITSLEGEVADNRVVSDSIEWRSAYTIVADVNANKKITVTDNIYYHTRPDKTKDSTDPVNLAAGTLGIVAKDIEIDSTAPANLEIDAVCLAGGQNTSGGSFYVENYDSKTPTGTLSVLGGIIQKARGPVGTFNSSTGQTTTGYAKNYRYDPRLASDPPPYYPTTGQYERYSWQVLAD